MLPSGSLNHTALKVSHDITAAGTGSRTGSLVETPAGADTHRPRDYFCDVLAIAGAADDRHTGYRANSFQAFSWPTLTAGYQAPPVAPIRQVRDH